MVRQLHDLDELAADGLVLVVRDASFQYHHPARLDDELEVDADVADPAADLRRASMRFTQRACRTDDGRLLVTGLVRVACVGAASGRPVAFPDPLLARMTSAAARRTS